MLACAYWYGLCSAIRITVMIELFFLIIGILQHPDGTVLKQLQPPPRGPREMQFYSMVSVTGMFYWLRSDKSICDTQLIATIVLIDPLDYKKTSKLHLDNKGAPIDRAPINIAR